MKYQHISPNPLKDKQGVKIVKKKLLLIVAVSLLAVPSNVISDISQEHKHEQQGSIQYKELLERQRVRMYWQMPLRVMDELGIKSGMTVADVGAGIGYFTLKIAQRLGETGKVYASDIDNEALSFLEERRKEAGLNNITIIQVLPQGSVVT